LSVLAACVAMAGVARPVAAQDGAVAAPPAPEAAPAETPPSAPLAETAPEGPPPARKGPPPGERIKPLRVPSAEEFNRLYPPAAARAGIGGKAQVVCVVEASGALRDCKLKSEEPAGYGFGEAGVKLASSMLVQVKASNGASFVGTNLSIPIGFRMAEPADRAPAPADAKSVEAPQKDASAPSGATAPSPEPVSPPRPPAPDLAPGSLWVVAGFAALMLLGMPLALFWPAPRRARRNV
jgi:outer membrane biosynthesis protein TonB